VIEMASSPRADGGTHTALTLSGVIVDFRSGHCLVDCVESLMTEGVTDLVVVDNAGGGTSRGVLGHRLVRIVEPGMNLGYGRGVNRGVAELDTSDLLVVSNPDVVVHWGAIAAMASRFAAETDLGVLGPTIVTPQGATYPSVRVFPSAPLAAAHALFASWWPSNPFTARYRSPGRRGRVDWVSGAFFLIRRDLFERLGGFDESYFMFAEDMDLCWRAGRLGARIDVCPEAIVTHVEGVSRRHNPRAALIAHHRSAMKFEWRTSRGFRRLLAPFAIALLALRLVVELLRGSSEPKR
jgi:N-acetylglucosaminyl-diphospho-decaprenol L-rhamnosyltransferase